MATGIFLHRNIENVLISSVADKDGLVYESASGNWINSPYLAFKNQQNVFTTTQFIEIATATLDGLVITTTDDSSTKSLFEGRYSTDEWGIRLKPGFLGISSVTTGGTYLSNIQFNVVNDRYPFLGFSSSTTAKAQMMVDVSTGSYYIDSLGNVNFRSAINGGTTIMSIRNGGNVLIGSTTDGSEKLQITGSVKTTDYILVEKDGGSGIIEIDSYGTGNRAQFVGKTAHNTKASPSAVQAGDIIFYFGGHGYGTSQFSATADVLISFRAIDAFTNTSHPTYITFETTPVSSVTRAEIMRVTSNVLIGSTTDDGTNKLQVTGKATISDTLTVPGISNLSNPHGRFSSSINNTVASTTTAYSVAFDTDDVKVKITHSTVTNNSRITLSEAGTYVITISVVADTSGANTHLDLWLAVDGSNIANTNRIVHIPTASAEITLTVVYTYTFTANQYFEIKYRGDNTGVRLLATAAGASPTRPAAPSAICTVHKVAV